MWFLNIYHREWLSQLIFYQNSFLSSLLFIHTRQTHTHAAYTYRHSYTWVVYIALPSCCKRYWNTLFSRFVEYNFNGCEKDTLWLHFFLLLIEPRFETIFQHLSFSFSSNIFPFYTLPLRFFSLRNCKIRGRKSPENCSWFLVPFKFKQQ